MVERAKTTLERFEHKRTNDLMAEVEAAIAIFGPKVATPMPNLALATTSQDMLATLTTTKTLLLLTSSPQFEQTVNHVRSASSKSSESNSHHTDKLPSGAPSNAKAFPDAAKVQMDLLLAN